MALQSLTLSMTEVAQLLGISRRTAWRLIQEYEELPSIKIGGRRMVTRAALDDYLKSLSETA